MTFKLVEIPWDWDDHDNLVIDGNRYESFHEYLLLNARTIVQDYNMRPGDIIAPEPVDINDDHQEDSYILHTDSITFILSPHYWTTSRTRT